MFKLYQDRGNGRGDEKLLESEELEEIARLSAEMSGSMDPEEIFGRGGEE